MKVTVFEDNNFNRTCVATTVSTGAQQTICGEDGRPIDLQQDFLDGGQMRGIADALHHFTHVCETFAYLDISEHVA